MLSFVFRFVLGSVKRGKHLYSPTPLCFFWFVFSFRWTKWSECFWDNSQSRVQQRACYAWKLNMYQQKWWGPSSKETCWPVKFIANFWSKDLSQMKKKKYLLFTIVHPAGFEHSFILYIQSCDEETDSLYLLVNNKHCFPKFRYQYKNIKWH